MFIAVNLYKTVKTFELMRGIEWCVEPSTMHANYYSSINS
jgi:hypothetical protein